MGQRERTPSERLVTESVTMDGRPFEFWRDDICDGLLGADSPSKPVELGGRLDFTVVQDVVAIDIQLRRSALAIGRTPERIAHEKRSGAIGLTYVMRGTSRVETPRGELQLRPGDVSLLYSHQEFTKEMSADYREHFLYLPDPAVRAVLGKEFPELPRIIAPQQGLGPLLADTLASLARRRPELRPEEWPPLLTAVLQIAGAAFHAPEDAEQQERTRLGARVLQRERVLRYVDAHLGDPELGPTTIAAALGLSLRYLHLLFEDSGKTLGETILGRRLDRARELLTDPAMRHLNIGEIAFSCGFNDTAHFSRTFKARFGERPSDARALSASGALFER